MKKYLSIILAVLVIASVLRGCVGQANTPEQSMVSNTDAPASTPEPEDVPDTSFSKEDHEKLLALQFEDYRHMTIAEFQNKVWEMTDTPEYSELLSRLSKAEALYALRDNDETAAFIYYVLEPLTKEKWQSHTYSGAASSDLPVGQDNARLEYTYTLTILAADKVKVKDEPFPFYRTQKSVQILSDSPSFFKLQNQAASALRSCASNCAGDSQPSAEWGRTVL